MKLLITTTYTATPTATIELPIKSWDEVKDWYIKWDTLHYTTDGITWNEIILNSLNDLDIIDWKRPGSTDIYDESNKRLDFHD